MSNCVICSTKLRFSNKPLMGAGKLKDGGMVCTNCFKDVIPAIEGATLKKYTLSEVKEMLTDLKSVDNEIYGDYNKIVNHIKTLPILGLSQVLKSKELKDLPNILSDNEVIDHIIRGSYNDGIGLLVCTKRRVVFIDRGMVYGLKVEDFPLSKINSIQYEKGVLLSKLKIQTSGNTTVIDNIVLEEAIEFVKVVNDNMENKSNNQTIVQVQPKESDVFEKLEKLQKLKESGILTDEEFELKKIELLNQI